MEYYPPPGPLCDLNGTNTSFLWNVSTGPYVNFTGMPVNITASTGPYVNFTGMPVNTTPSTGPYVNFTGMPVNTTPSTGPYVNFTGMPVNTTPSNSTGISNHSAGTSLKVKEKVNQPNTALLSVILTFGTFLIAWFLKQLRNSQFFGRTVGFSDLNLINK